MDYRANQTGAVTTARIDYSNSNTDHLLFISSDLHIDSVLCNRDKLLGDLTDAKERGAMILLIGDVFDAMQGRFDPRRSLDELRPEYRRQDYYDFVVQDVARILSPLGTKSTIGANGCLMTCVSMVCNHFGHASNPLQLNDWLTANEGYLDGNRFLWASIERLYPDMKFDGFVYNPTAQQIKAVILAGVLPIMFVDFNDDTPLDEMHWVLGIGVTNGDVIIADPWTGTIGKLSEMYPKSVIRYGSYIRI